MRSKRIQWSGAPISAMARERRMGSRRVSESGMQGTAEQDEMTQIDHRNLLRQKEMKDKKERCKIIEMRGKEREEDKNEKEKCQVDTNAPH